MDLAIFRFLANAAAALAAGLTLLPWLLGNAAAVEREGDRLADRLVLSLALVRIAAGLGLISAVAALALERTPNLGELFAFVRDTHVGRVWLVGESVAALFAVLAGLKLALPKLPAWLTHALAALGIVILVWVPLTGHVLDAEGSLIARAGFLAHALAALAWFGGLGAMIYWLIRFGSADPRRAHRLAQRFSTFAQICMAVVFAGGIFFAVEQVGASWRLFATASGRLIVIKLVLLSCALFVAWRLRGYLRSLRADASSGGDGVGFAPKSYALNAAFEATFAIGVLALASLVASSVPPAHDQTPLWPFSFRLSYAGTWALGTGVNLAIAGAAIGLLGLGVLAWPRLGRFRRPAGAAAIAAAATCVAVSLSVPAYPDTYKTSPTAMTVESAARGYHLFQQNCLVCHGPTGEGDGPLAPNLVTRPANLTAPHAAAHTIGDMFHWLSYGLNTMPAVAGLSDDDKWDVINFLHVLTKTYDARLLSEQDSGRWLVAPDIRLEQENGSESTLRDLRGKPVLLSFVTCSDGAPKEDLARLQAAVSAHGGALVATAKGSCGAAPAHAFKPAEPEAAELAFAFWNRTFGREFSTRIERAHFLIDNSGYVRARYPSLAAEDAVSRLGSAIEQLKAEPFDPPPDDHH